MFGFVFQMFIAQLSHTPYKTPWKRSSSIYCLETSIDSLLKNLRYSAQCAPFQNKKKLLNQSWSHTQHAGVWRTVWIIMTELKRTNIHWLRFVLIATVHPIKFSIISTKFSLELLQNFCNNRIFMFMFHLIDQL